MVKSTNILNKLRGYRKMKFYWFGLTLVLLYVVQIILSVMEKIFFSSQDKSLDLPLAEHWGVLVGDPILMAAYYLMADYLKFSWLNPILLILSFIISWKMHQRWWNIRGHIFPNHYGSRRLTGNLSDPKAWFRDFSEAGWCHYFFFSLMLYIIVEYAITPMPAAVIMPVTILLLIFAPFGVFQPGWAEWSRKRLREPSARWFWQSFISLAGMWVAILIVYYCKI